MSLSIILTCYNEVPVIFNSYQILATMMNRTNIDCEFIVIDDGSKPNTQRKLWQYFGDLDQVQLVLSKQNKGRGSAVSKGIRSSTCQYVCFIDTDLEIPSYSILALYNEAISSNSDVVIAERMYKWGINPRHNIRNLCSKAYRRFSSLVLSLENLDTETGSKLFRRTKIMPILERTLDQRWFWDTEIIAESLKDSQKIVQIPIPVVRCPNKSSSVHVLREIYRYLKAIHSYRKRSALYKTKQICTIETVR